MMGSFLGIKKAGKERSRGGNIRGRWEFARTRVR